MTKTEKCFVGIDVSKDALDLTIRPEEDRWTIQNDEKGLQTMVARLLKRKPNLVALEATVELQMPTVVALASAKLPVVVANPRQIRDFAKAIGKLAKTDPIDSAVIARFGAAVRPEVRPLPDAETQELADLFARRRQLLDMATAEKNRLNTATEKVHKDIKAHIAWLEKHIKDAENDLSKRIKQSPV